MWKQKSAPEGALQTVAGAAAFVLTNLLDEEGRLFGREGAVAVAADVEGMVVVGVGASEVAFLHAIEGKARKIIWRVACF